MFTGSVLRTMAWFVLYCSQYLLKKTKPQHIKIKNEPRQIAFLH